MKIITAYPIVKDGKVIANKIAANTLNFHSADGDIQPKGQKIFDALKKAKEAGLGDAVLNTISALRNRNKAAPAPEPQKQVIVTAPQHQGMSTNTKILLGVGGVLLLGVLIYVAKKK